MHTLPHRAMLEWELPGRGAYFQILVLSGLLSMEVCHDCLASMKMFSYSRGASFSYEVLVPPGKPLLPSSSTPIIPSFFKRTAAPC